MNGTATGSKLRYDREIFTQQTQAPAKRNARSKQWQRYLLTYLPWLAACQRKRLRFLRFSFTQRTQRKRLRLNGNRALVRRSIGPDHNALLQYSWSDLEVFRRCTDYEIYIAKHRVKPKNGRKYRLGTQQSA